MLPEAFFADMLRPSETIVYYVNPHLRALYPGRFVLEATSRLALEDYAHAGECVLELRDVPLAGVVTEWEGVEREPRRHARNGWYTVGWHDRRLGCLRCTWQPPQGTRPLSGRR